MRMRNKSAERKQDNEVKNYSTIWEGLVMKASTYGAADSPAKSSYQAVEKACASMENHLTIEDSERKRSLTRNITTLSQNSVINSEDDHSQTHVKEAGIHVIILGLRRNSISAAVTSHLGVSE